MHMSGGGGLDANQHVSHVDFNCVIISYLDHIVGEGHILRK